MKNDILFIGGTHGDEPIGVVALKHLSEKRNDFDWIIGNPPAIQRNVRYIENDLNRSAPGDLLDPIWEKRRAAEILQISKKYTYTIDIHGAKNDLGIFILIANPTRENLLLASLLNIKNIVIWPSITPEMKYPMSEFFNCGFEIECGLKEEYPTSEKLLIILNEFLDLLSEGIDLQNKKLNKKILGKNVYEMVGSLKKSEVPNTLNLKEFEEIDIQGEKIAPIFIGTYEYQEILGYKLKKLSDESIKKYL